MDDQQLFAELQAIHTERRRVPDARVIRQQLLALPLHQTPQRRSWLPLLDTRRFQSMFSATKFVVAGAIVALFGGFLLAGVLTQPSDDRLPVVGATATAEPRPTDVVTAEPVSTPETTTQERSSPFVRADLVPGVDLEVVETGPGVFRVLGDGIRGLRKNVYDIAVSGRGEVFITKADDSREVRDRSVQTNLRVIRLGDADVLRFDRSLDPRLETIDGTVVLERETNFDGDSDSRVFNGRRWTRGPEPREADGCDGARAMGACWSVERFKPGRPPLAVVSSDGQRIDLAEIPELGVNEAVHNVLAAGVDTIWLDVYAHTRPLDDPDLGPGTFQALLAYDGSDWSRLEAPTGRSTENCFPRRDLGLDREGTLWLASISGCRSTTGVPVQTLHLDRWDGERWSSFEVAGYPNDHHDRLLRFSDDGAIWIGGLTRFDGSDFVILDQDRLGSDRGVVRVVHGTPNGAVWVLTGSGETGDDGVYTETGGGLYVITPEAVAAAENVETEPTWADEQTADASTAPDLLPGVDLVTEEVAPGVYRVLSDGTHDLREDTWDVAVTPEGAVWLEQYRIEGYGGPGVDPGQARTSDHRRFRLGDPDSLVEGEGGLDIGEEQACDAVESDGSCWWNDLSMRFGGAPRPDAMGDGTDPMRWMMRVAPDGSQQLFTQEDLGLPPESWFGGRVFVADDGTVWTDHGITESDEGVWAGLAAYDGADWSLVEFDGPVVAGTEPTWTVAPDGTNWVAAPPRGAANTLGYGRPEYAVWSWDGDRWTEHGVVPLWAWAEDPHRIRARPDGSVWFDPLTVFDGSGLRQLGLPASASNQQPILSRYGFAPDGSAWLIVLDAVTPEDRGCPTRGECRGATDGVYVITPEAIADAE